MKVGDWVMSSVSGRAGIVRRLTYDTDRACWRACVQLSDGRHLWVPKAICIPVTEAIAKIAQS
jgi:hypothetical protein